METASINNSFQKLDYSVRTRNCDVETCALAFTEASAIFQWKESHHLSMGNPHANKIGTPPPLMNLGSIDSGEIATYIKAATRQMPFILSLRR